MRTYRISALAGVAAAVTLMVGCATMAPPTDELANAELAVRKAEQANAPQYSPLEMRVAREKLQEARDLSRSEQNDDLIKGRRLAEDALVQAQLAEAVANKERAKANLAEAQQTIDTLRDEISRGQK